MTEEHRHNVDKRLRILLVGLYSERYPAVGETHGLSVIAGAFAEMFTAEAESILVLDMVAIGNEDVAPIAAAISEMNPNVVGISVPYGTYDSLIQLRGEISRLLDEGKCVILGGALPSYVGARMLAEIDPRVIIVVGEGEHAAVRVVQSWLAQGSFHSIPNLQFKSKGVLFSTPRQIVKPEKIPAPYRHHIANIVASGAQVFVESSRACSWAACSFCLRGITDIEGKPGEYRRLPICRLVADLKQLNRIGVKAVTFADEDFLGGDHSEIIALLEELEKEVLREGLVIPSFDVSATIHSIFRLKDSDGIRTKKAECLRRFYEIGLRKVFLGIESGSATQLKRYRKGHSKEECVKASSAVIASGARLEIGFIMFDPLCTLQEISENVRFLLDNELVQYVSSPTSELRLQAGSRYIPLLERTEQKLGRRLYSRELDVNTLSYEYFYVDEEVGALVSAVRDENIRGRDFIYRTKGLTRFGDGLILGDRTNEVRILLGEYRHESLLALEESARSGVRMYGRLCQEATSRFASKFLELTNQDDNRRPLVSRTIEAAIKYLNGK